MEKIKKLYVDRPSWNTPICVDDFIVTIGVKQSNSVYHILDVNPKPIVKNKMVTMKGKMIRYYIKVFDSDLITALKRDKTQQLIPIQWYKR